MISPDTRIFYRPQDAPLLCRLFKDRERAESEKADTGKTNLRDYYRELRAEKEAKHGI